MRPQRNKQFDWSKPFKLVESKKDFEQIETAQDLVIAVPTKQSQAHKPGYQKQNIVTPRIQTRPRVTTVKPFAKITPNYIRLTPRLNLPQLVDYELTEVEIVFVKTHAERLKFKGRVLLTKEFLSKAFIQLEFKAGKDMTLRRSKAWMDEYLDREYKDLHEWEQFDAFSALIYNFWKNRREELKFPLLRPLWRPNPDQFNHLLAFKPRQKQKRNLRKTTRVSEDDILAELNDEFNIAKQISQRVEMREELRLKHLQSQLAIFHNECKAFFGVPSFFGEVMPENRVKDKERVRYFHQKLDKLKLKREEPLEPQIEPAPQQTYDQKLSVVNFMSTVIAEAEVFGINYASIFQSRQEAPSLVISQIPQQAPSVEEPRVNEPLLNINYSRAGDYLIRDFQEVELSESESSSQLTAERGPKRYFSDIFEYKKKMVCSLYFGDDDEGDFKDLKKNISTNFKKFQAQIKQP